MLVRCNMDIKYSNNQNFTSAYRFSAIQNKSYKDLHRLISKPSSKIFNCVNEKGDVVLVNHSCYDERVKNFIKKNKLCFQFFPNIKLNDNLTKDTLKSLIIREIKEKNTISNIFVLSDHVMKNNISRGKSLVKHMNNIFKTLRLNVDKPEIHVMENGLSKIRDNSKLRTIYVSPNYASKYYVYVKPDSLNQESSRYLLFHNGKKLIKEYRTPEEIAVFKKNSCIISN